MSDTGPRFPKLAPGLQVNTVSDGHIVHQPDRDRVHYLNNTAAILLELCTGKVAESEMPRLLQDAYELAAPPEEEVRQCLESLRREGLIL